MVSLKNETNKNKTVKKNNCSLALLHLHCFLHTDECPLTFIKKSLLTQTIIITQTKPNFNRTLVDGHL